MKCEATISELGRRLSEVTLQLHQAVAARAGLSGTDHKYVGTLMRHGPMTAGQLGDHTGLSSGAITGLVDRLEAKGLVRREADASDRRKVLIVPHATNIDALLGPMSRELAAHVAAHVRELPPGEAEIVERYLRQMIVILSELTTRYRAPEPEDSALLGSAHTDSALKNPAARRALTSERD